MAIKYKIIQKGQPGVVGGGIKKFYATIVLDGEVTIDDLVKEIEKFSSLSEPDIYGVIVALENVIQNKLGESKIVRLEKLGNFYPSISSEGVEKEEDAGEQLIKDVNVNYRPGKRVKKGVNDAGFKKVK